MIDFWLLVIIMEEMCADFLGENSIRLSLMDHWRHSFKWIPLIKAKKPVHLRTAVIGSKPFMHSSSYAPVVKVKQEYVMADCIESSFQFNEYTSENILLI